MCCFQIISVKYKYSQYKKNTLFYILLNDIGSKLLFQMSAFKCYVLNESLTPVYT